MTIKVAINGFGRIGRNILRAHYESVKKHDLQFVAINDLADAKTNAHLLKYDTVHGRFRGAVEVSGSALKVNEMSSVMTGVDAVILTLGVPSKREQEGHHRNFGTVHRLPQYPLLHVHRLP